MVSYFYMVIPISYFRLRVSCVSLALPKTIYFFNVFLIVVLFFYYIIKLIKI